MIVMASIKHVQEELERTKTDRLIAPFFFQHTDPALNTAVSALRALIFVLIDQHKSLIRHIQAKYDSAGDGLFEGPNAFFALWAVLEDILRDPGLPPIFLFIDALDECGYQQTELLKHIIRFRPTTPQTVKWFLTSRNESWILDHLAYESVCSNISLELNARSVSYAVTLYVKAKVRELTTRKRYTEELASEVETQLEQKAMGTFLWVALVCDELQKLRGVRHVRKVLAKFHPGIQSLYERFMFRIEQLDDYGDADCCRAILAFVTLAYRPPSVQEVSSMADLPADICGDAAGMSELLDLCAPFVIVRTGTVYFIHQSAKDFFVIGDGLRIFTSGLEDAHHKIGMRALHIMSENLKEDICNVGGSGCMLPELRDHSEEAFPSQLPYPCTFWATHFCRPSPTTSTMLSLEDLNMMATFFHTHLLHWLEGSAIIGQMSEVLRTIGKIEEAIHIFLEHAAALEGSKIFLGPWPEVEHFKSLIYDIKRFVLWSRNTIEKAPLQTYTSCLIFSPNNSLVKKLYSRRLPVWLQGSFAVEDNWSACLQTLEGHSEQITAMKLAPSSQSLATGAVDKTARLWEPGTGYLNAVLEGHSDWISAVEFSADGALLVSASGDGTVRVWCAIEKRILRILNRRLDGISAMTFSPDGQLLAFASGYPFNSENTDIQLWDRLGDEFRALGGHVAGINALVFSPDGALLASASSDETVRLWDIQAGGLCSSLQGHSDNVNAIDFSPDGKLLASASDDGTVMLWGVKDRNLEVTLSDDAADVTAVLFSPDGELIASASRDEIVRIWSSEGKKLHLRLEGHSSWVNDIVFSPDGKMLASASSDCTIRLWDVTIGQLQHKFDGHTEAVQKILFSSDCERIYSASTDRTIKVWNAAARKSSGMTESHKMPFRAVVFSPNGLVVASAGTDSVVRLWNPRTGESLFALRNHCSWINAVAFSSDSRLMLSASGDHSIRLWSTKTGRELSTLQGHTDQVMTAVFSPDNKLIASGSHDCNVVLWDVEGKGLSATLQGHEACVRTVAFSPNGKFVASGSDDFTIRLWNIQSGRTCREYHGHLYCVTSVSFLKDGDLIVSASMDRTIRIWSCSEGTQLAIYDTCGFEKQVSISRDGRWLQTDKGTVILSSQDPVLCGVPSTSSSPLHLDSGWVTWNSRRLLWLPSEYHTGSFATHGNILAVGHSSGHVAFLTFDPTLCSNPNYVV
jgi:WD40 repeat protein